MNRRDFTRRAMFGLFGGAAAVTATEVKPQGRFPQKNRFRHKTGLGWACGGSSCLQSSNF